MSRLVASYGSGTGVLAIARRGGAALGPENTVEAFQRAVDMGYGYLETDVRMTRDGVCVAFHDRAVRRVTGRPAVLDAMYWDQVQQLTVLGRSRVPTIQELLDRWPSAYWMLDIKAPAALPALAACSRQPMPPTASASVEAGTRCWSRLAASLAQA
jgi:glycerophosphoryl diester phosphodiesterase